MKDYDISEKEVMTIMKKVSANIDDFREYVERKNENVAWEDYEDETLRIGGASRG